MQPEIPWNVAGVSPEVREAARAAARREGLSIGEWLERRIAAGPVAAPAPDVGEFQTVLTAQLEAFFQTVESRLAEVENRQQDENQALAQNLAKTASALHEQGLIVDRLVSQFVSVSERLERPADPVGPTAQDWAAVLEQLTALSDRAQDFAGSLHALEGQITRLRADTLAAVDGVEDRLSALEYRLSAAAAPLSEPLSVAPTAMPSAPSVGRFSPEDVDVAPLSPSAPDVPPMTLETVVPEPAVADDAFANLILRRGGAQAELAKTPLRKLDDLDADEAEGAAAAEQTGTPADAKAVETSNRRPLALLLLVVVAAVIASAGLLFSRQGGWFGADKSSQISVSSPVRLAASAAAPAVPAASEGKTSTADKSVDPVAQIKTMAIRGNAKAALVLAGFYADGRGGVPRSDKDAVQWLDLAAKDGHPVAQFRLGERYERGLGVAVDPVRAASLFLAAARGGHAQAMARIAADYAAGAGVKQDYTEAARWFSKAAQYGLSDPQFNLAVLYEQGKGVPQSFPNAYKWYAIAAAHGDAEARTRMTDLAGQLSADDRRDAKAAADAFKPHAPDPAANDTPKPVDVLKETSPSSSVVSASPRI